MNEMIGDERGRKRRGEKRRGGERGRKKGKEKRRREDRENVLEWLDYQRKTCIRDSINLMQFQ